MKSIYEVTSIHGSFMYVFFLLFFEVKDSDLFTLFFWFQCAAPVKT